MDYDFQILRLTELFFESYPIISYPELLSKNSRSYNCLLIDLYYDYFICIPYRTEIHHTNAFKFRTTKRSMHHQSGLDYSKIVIVTNDDYIESKSSLIDHDEYIQTVRNIRRIVKEADSYIRGYVMHCNGEKILDVSDFQRKYKYSTLKYFHRELRVM